MENQFNDKNCIYTSLKIGGGIYVWITTFFGFVMSLILFIRFNGIYCNYYFPIIFKLIFQTGAGFFTILFFLTLVGTGLLFFHGIFSVSL